MLNYVIYIKRISYFFNVFSNAVDLQTILIPCNYVSLSLLSVVITRERCQIRIQ